jgi:hypothetical protein
MYLVVGARVDEVACCPHVFPEISAIWSDAPCIQVTECLLKCVSYCLIRSPPSLASDLPASSIHALHLRLA